MSDHVKKNNAESNYPRLEDFLIFIVCEIYVISCSMVPPFTPRCVPFGPLHVRIVLLRASMFVALRAKHERSSILMDTR